MRYVLVPVRCTRLQPVGTGVYTQTHTYTYIVTHELPAPRPFSAKGFVPGAGLQPRPGPSCHPWQRPARQKPRLPRSQASGCPSTAGREGRRGGKTPKGATVFMKWVSESHRAVLPQRCSSLLDQLRTDAHASLGLGAGSEEGAPWPGRTTGAGRMPCSSR